MRRLPRLAAAVLSLAVLPAPVLAYWGVTPAVDSGIVLESNPRYVDDSIDAESATGVFVDVRADLLSDTGTNLLRLTPRIRKTDYLRSNKDLNDDDLYTDFEAIHRGRRGQVGATLGYRDIAVRTGEFEGATPENPDENPIPGGGSGLLRDVDESQETMYARPYVTYFMSPRNSVRLGADFSETDYDAPPSSGYFDYSYSTVDLTLTHSLDTKNAFLMTLSSSSFEADQDSRQFRNESDSYGLSVAFQRALAPTWAADVSLGTNRSNVSTLSLFSFVPDTINTPLPVPCYPVACRATDQNFVGDLSVRKRSENRLLNFSIGRALSPRSDGTEVVQDKARFLIDQKLAAQLSGSLAFVYLDETAVGDFSRQNRDYFSTDLRLRWQWERNWAFFVSYSYSHNQNKNAFDESTFNFNDDQTNNRVFFGVSWRGTQWRW